MITILSLFCVLAIESVQLVIVEGINYNIDSKLSVWYMIPSIIGQMDMVWYMGML